MKKFNLFSLLTIILAIGLQSCRDVETYAESKKKEKKAIQAFIANNDIISNIEVISESQFESQGETTKSIDKGDATNQFVLFSSTGVYMQIVNKGAGAKLADGESKNILCRYTEYDIMNSDTLSTNIYYSSIVDKLIVTNSSGSFSATFTEGNMYSKYESSYVPQGWLVPFTYINLGRETDNLAHVRLIVPHTYGTSTASSSIYPTFYDITFQSGR